MSPVAKYRGVLLLLFLHVFLSGAMTCCLAAAEPLPVRLVALVDQDDQGMPIEFPVSLFYDHWASETYLISSTGRMTIYDQKFFPVASFGKGRGLAYPSGVAVDRRGSIYVCQEKDDSDGKPRLTIYNQAFFPIKTVVFANIPELAEFTADKVAVAESGEIYLAGHKLTAGMEGVVVLSPEGKFLRIVVPPEKSAWRPWLKKPAAPGAERAQESNAVAAASVTEADESFPIPAGLKPKAAAANRDEADEQAQRDYPYISDVKIDPQGRIYLLSREVSIIYVLNAKEEFLFKFGEKGGVPGKLSNPISLGVDLGRRVIYVCDYMRHTILCYDYDSGRFVFEFGGRGVGPLWFNFPNNVEVDQRGRVVVADFFNRRLQVIDPNMDERRPLAGLLPAALVAGTRPATEEARVSPELPAPTPAGILGQVVTPPLVLPVASLPAPPPPEPSFLGRLVAVLSPAAVTPPVLPLGMVGVQGLEQGRGSLPTMTAPPFRERPAPPRELAPRAVKKATVSLAPQLQMATFSPVQSPVRFAKPTPIQFPQAKVVRSARRLAAVPVAVLQRFMAMPAAVGVYGPVASLLGVGSWMLSSNR